MRVVTTGAHTNEVVNVPIKCYLVDETIAQNYSLEGGMTVKNTMCYAADNTLQAVSQ